jgi:DNA-binding protein YbaB
MWILKWLPDWIFYVTLLAGVVGYLATYVLKFIPLPFVNMYKTPIQLGSIALLVIGTFMTGAIHDNNAWLDRVHEMEAKVAKAEEEAKAANVVIDKKTVEKVKVIKGKQIIVRQYIDREVAKYDSQCVIPKEFVKAHNDAAEEPK